MDGVDPALVAAVAADAAAQVQAAVCISPVTGYVLCLALVFAALALMLPAARPGR